MLNQTIKPIEAFYHGCRFRSMLEKRWAVFFDTLGLDWEYEPGGFQVKSTKGYAVRYLPDFYIPKFDTYFEVKPDISAEPQLGKTKKAIERYAAVMDWKGQIKRLVFLSTVPYGCDGGMWHFPALYFWQDGMSGPYLDTGWWFFSGKSKEDVYGKISSAKYPKPFYLSYGHVYDNPKRPFSIKAVSDSELKRELGFKSLNRNSFADDYNSKVSFQLDENALVFKAFESAYRTRAYEI